MQSPKVLKSPRVKPNVLTAKDDPYSATEISPGLKKPTQFPVYKMQAEEFKKTQPNADPSMGSISLSKVPSQVSKVVEDSIPMIPSMVSVH